MMTVIAAIVGFVICLATVKLGNKIRNRLARYGVMILGIILGLGSAGALASNSQTAGMIVGGLAIFYTVFFEKKRVH